MAIILHTSDWHLGQKLFDRSRQVEQKMFLDWLTLYIREHNVDILLVAGDIFDTTTPSAESLKLYYNFLVDVKESGCKHVVITGGNHDSPNTLDAPKELLSSLEITVVGKSGDVEDEIVSLEVGDERIVIAATPYLRDRDIRRAVAGESFNELGERYYRALTNHYRDVAEVCSSSYSSATTLIAMGHLFVIGGSPSESEQSIYVGNLGDISISDFPESFDYIALGHLHRAQDIKGDIVAKYSGSPYPLSFSEAGQEKSVVSIKTHCSEPMVTERIPIPIERELITIKGSSDDLLIKIKELDVREVEIDESDIDLELESKVKVKGLEVEAFNATESYIGSDSEAKVKGLEGSLEPWYEVVITDRNFSSTIYRDIEQLAEDIGITLLRIVANNQIKIAGLEAIVEQSKQVRDFTPEQIFQMKCDEEQLSEEDYGELYDLFCEALNSAREES